MLEIFRWAATGGIITKSNALLIWGLGVNEQGSAEEQR